MQITYFVLTCFIFIGSFLNNKNSNKSDAIETKIDLNSIVSIDTTIKIVKTQTPFNGEIYYKAGWQDGNGENIIILSKNTIYNDGNGRVEIYAYLYNKKKDSDYKVVWDFFDFVNGDGCDLTIDIPKDFIKISDLDNDSLTELSFIYTLDNRCDASIVPTKMLIRVLDKSYSISGFSKLSLGPSEEVMNNYLKEQGQPAIAYKVMSKNWGLLNKSFRTYYSLLWDEYAKQ